MPITYYPAPEVRDIAMKLIVEHHTHLVDNGYVRIEYIFRSEASTSNGKTVYGKARKIAGLSAYLATIDDAKEQVEADKTTVKISRAKGPAAQVPAVQVPVAEWDEVEPFFVIEIAHDVWEVLDKNQKEALVDHELCHLQITEGKLALRAHDVEEFGAVLRRHGIWSDGLQQFLKNLKSNQLDLVFDEPPES